MPRRVPSTMVSSVVSAGPQTTREEHAEDHHTSTLTSFFTEDEVESVINTVFGASSSIPPRRFAMEDILKVDNRSFGLLQASSRWKGMLPHIERIIDAEGMTPPNNARFVARTFRRRPGVVYAVRYWEGLAGTASLAAALTNVQQAWVTSSRQSQSTYDSSQGAPSVDDGKTMDANSHEDRKPKEVTAVESTSDQTSSASVDDRENSEDVPAARDEAAICTQGGPSSNTIVATPATPQTAPINDPGDDAQSGDHSKARGTPTDAMAARANFVPEDTLVLGSTPSTRSSPVQVLGFAVGIVNPSKVNVALVSEWPGIGSLHDLLSGKIQLARGASQEELVRWTRQVAEGLVHVSRRDPGGYAGKSTLHMCTRNIFLFPRTHDEFQEGPGMVDVRVATFLGGCSTPDAGDRSDAAVEAGRYLLPPEFLVATPDAIIPSSPTKFNVVLGQGSFDREAANVWGIGTVVFELSTGRVTGPTPLAYRQLRDLLRDVPIDPRFIYGDVARGVMRIALQRRPRERARAAEVAAIVEQISARTLRRAYAASDRQSRLKRMRRRAADDGRVRGGQTHENGCTIDDGYGQALAQWRINEAVERAEGRAKIFLRQLWFNSLTNDDKRRIRHRRRHRKVNKEAREWRGRRVRAALMHHWTPVQVASWVSHLLRRAEVLLPLARVEQQVLELNDEEAPRMKALASRKLPLLRSGDAKGATVSMGGDDGEDNATGATTRPHGDETSTANATSTKDGENADMAANAVSTSIKQASEPGQTTSDVSLACAEIVKRPSFGESVAAIDTANVGQGGDCIKDVDAQNNGGTAVGAAEGAAKGEFDDEKDCDGPDQGDDVCDKDEDDDDLSSSVEGEKDGWAGVEGGERTGYSGAEVEPFAVQEGIDGTCVLEAMNDAMKCAEDALTRFVKSSTRLVRPDEVEKKRVDLMVKELLTIRPYSSPNQIKIRGLAVVIVRSAEAPRKLTEDEIFAHLPSLARVLTAGYRRQAAMVEQGLELAAARIQGLARGKHVRRVVSAIWRQAEEYARNIVRGEREAKMKKEKEERSKAKEKALELEREEAKRYRLRLVPRASSVTCRSMTISVPTFLVAAARGVKRFLVVETTILPPPPPRQQPSLLPHPPNGGSCTLGTAAVTATAAADDESNADNPENNSINAGNRNGNSSDGSWQFADREGCGQVHVLLRQGAAAELNAPSESESTTTTTVATEAGDDGIATQPDVTKGSGENAAKGTRTYLRAVGNELTLSELCPCTTYRLTLEVPPIVRDDLLESARSLGLTEAIRSLEAPPGSETVGDHSSSDDYGGGRAGGSGVTSAVAYLDVETLPDVPGQIFLVSCKVLTSASAVDPRDPGGVLSLRQWQSPYPGVANMDSPSTEDYIVLAPGRPEPLVSLHWKEPESNGLDVCSYVIERRIGRGGAWKKIRARGGNGADEERRRRLPDAVDAPLRTISVDTLRKVAIQGLTLGYRVYAENMLGNGAASKPVEVNLRAFLGHLRAKEEETGKACTASQQQYQQRAAPSMGPADMPSSLQYGDPLVSQTRPASADGKIDLAAGNNGSPSCTRPLDPLVEREVKQMQGGRRAPPLYSEAGDAQGAMPHQSPASSPPGAFGGDFMGLGGFGEDLVDNLFAPPSLTSRNRRRFHAPAARATEGAHSHEVERNAGKNGPYPLPPIVLVAGISGENRGENAAGTHKLGFDGNTQQDDEEREARDCENRCRGIATGDTSSLYGRSDSGVNTTNNDVFHAFINLGRRLPGRLRR